MGCISSRRQEEEGLLEEGSPPDYDADEKSLPKYEEDSPKVEEKIFIDVNLIIATLTASNNYLDLLRIKYCPKDKIKESAQAVHACVIACGAKETYGLNTLPICYIITEWCNHESTDFQSAIAAIDKLRERR